MGTFTWAEALARYAEFGKLPDVASTGVQDSLIAFADAAVASRLSPRFSAPFSTNNMTAKDLGIDTLYVQTQMARQPDKAKGVLDWIDKRVEALLEGGNMVTSAGEVAGTLVSAAVWSNTSGDSPTFGVGDPLTWAVSSDAQQSEEDARD